MRKVVWIVKTLEGIVDHYQIQTPPAIVLATEVDDVALHALLDPRLRHASNMLWVDAMNEWTLLETDPVAIALERTTELCANLISDHSSSSSGGNVAAHSSGVAPEMMNSR
jgi:hypothetical protein